MMIESLRFFGSFEVCGAQVESVTSKNAGIGKSGRYLGSSLRGAAAA